jgi:hypothetical protein
MVMERTSITRALAPLERDGLFHIRAGSDKRTRITHKEGRKTNRQRQAQFGRSPEDTTEPHWRSALDGDARSFEGYNASGAPHTRGCKLTRYFEWRAGGYSRGSPSNDLHSLNTEIRTGITTTSRIGIMPNCRRTRMKSGKFAKSRQRWKSRATVREV